MAYDETLAARVRDALAGRETIVERQMFGGLGFLYHGNMAPACAATRSSPGSATRRTRPSPSRTCGRSAVTTAPAR